MTCSSLNSSLIRSLLTAPEFVEGWALYCEELVKDLGFSRRSRSQAYDGQRSDLEGCKDDNRCDASEKGDEF